MVCFGWDLGDFGYFKDFKIETMKFDDWECAFMILVWYDRQFVVLEGHSK